jgi:DNA-binding transcriptional MerR regulator
MIPNKSNFKFQELTPITGVKPYVIRFWETEFPEIAPITSDSGQKIYARKDIEAILKVKKLLFEDKLTICEAQAQMKTDDMTESKTETSNEFITNESHLSSRSLIEDSLDIIKTIKAKRNW